MAGPPQGLRVLDFATIIAAPFAATLLAVYGAEMPPLKDGKPLRRKAANRNKEFATLDLRTPEGALIHGAGLKGD